MTPKERLVKYLKYKGIGQNAFEKLCGISNGYISALKYQPSDRLLAKILLHTPDLNRVWLLTGEGDMLNEEKPEINQEGRGIPIYDETLSLGYVETAGEPITHPIGFLDLYAFRDCTCVCRATGHSMEPTISSGDLVVLQRITDLSVIINNEIYAIATSNGLQTIKRIRQEKDCFTLVADNPEYGMQELSPQHILQLYRVRGVLKTL